MARFSGQQIENPQYFPKMSLVDMSIITMLPNETILILLYMVDFKKKFKKLDIFFSWVFEPQIGHLHYPTWSLCSLWVFDCFQTFSSLPKNKDLLQLEIFREMY